ncbi:hypothetical protein U8V72_21430 [Priestia filamentosa]|uniref:hypothetical protein n=1 Tax=Priestia filamentosa TaxID=1402861 RepID=UPI0039795908
MKQIAYEYDKRHIEQYFGKNFFEKFYQYDKETDELRSGLDVNEPLLLHYIKTELPASYSNFKEGWVPEILPRIFYAYLFYKYGKKAFSFEKTLTEMLLETDLNNVDAEYVKLPFPCVYFDVPANIFKEELYGRIYSLIGMYVYDMPAENLSREAKDARIGKERDKYISVHAVLSTGEEISENVFTTVLNFDLRLKEGNIFEQLQENYLRSTFSVIEMDLADKIISFVINAILYLNSDKKIIGLVKPKHLDLLEGKKSPKKQKKLARKFKGKSNLEYYQLGKDIVISHEKKNGTTRVHRSDKLSSLSTSKQWIVRGHWRNQPFGKGLKERKYIWIKPYIKGNEESPLSGKNYTVK